MRGKTSSPCQIYKEQLPGAEKQSTVVKAQENKQALFKRVRIRNRCQSAEL